MITKIRRINGLIPWWYWVWFGHVAFTLVLFRFYVYRNPAWFKAIFTAISLAHERNYAVWWAGISLLMAALIFYRIGSSKRADIRDAVIWYILALVALSLSIDELGSLHELVSRVYGWLGLLPFALVLGLAFGYAIFHLVKSRDTRLTAILVLIAVGLFVSVAGLEYVEQSVFLESRALRRYRLVAEEGTEVVGMGLMVIAGIIAMARFGMVDRRLRVLAGCWSGLRYYREVVFLLFVIHVLGMLIYTIPNVGRITEGNPAFLFPIYIFFTTAIACFYRAGMPGAPGYLRATGSILLLSSLFQTYNLNRLFNNFLSVEVDWFTGPPGSWLATLIPLIAISYLLWRTNHIETRKVVTCILIILVVLLLVYPGDYRFMTYYMYSGSVAYACFWLLDTSTVPAREEAPPLEVTAGPSV